MNVFDVRVYGIRRRADRRRPFEVRWHAAGRARSRSFLTRGLADSYRAELGRATRQGLEFGPATGEPVLWSIPPVPGITWYRHARPVAGQMRTERAGDGPGQRAVIDRNLGARENTAGAHHVLPQGTAAGADQVKPTSRTKCPALRWS